MKEKENQADIDFSLFPEEIRPLVGKLISDEGMTRMRSRKHLVQLGPAYLSYYELLLNSANRLLRWETAKVIEEIADESSIPLFLNMMEDSDDDIRWIAAEGLIRVGKKSIRPLLEKLIHKGDSFFMKVGAHHILKSLSHGRERERLAPLLRALQNYGELDEMSELEASKVLQNLDALINLREEDGEQDRLRSG